MNEGYCSDNFRIGDVIYCVDYYDEKLAELFVELINDSFIKVGYGRNFSKRHDLYYHELSIPAEKKEK